MADAWEVFVGSAKLDTLKGVLGSLNLPTTGNKTTVKGRLQEAVKDFSDEQLLRLIPAFKQKSQDKDGGVLSDTRDEESGDDDDSVTVRGDDEESSDEENGDVENGGEEHDDEEINVNKELKRLKKLIKKKKEITKLRKELSRLQLEDEEVKQRLSAYTFRDMEDAITKFSGDDNMPVRKWIELFEETADAMDFDEKTKFIFGKRLLTGTAKLFSRSISAKSWKELKGELKNEFEKHVSKSDIHNQLRVRKKKSNETLQQYVLAMQEIACMGNIDEEDIVQYIVKGVPDSEVNKMLLYGASDIKELKQALRKYERLKMNTHESNQLNSAIKKSNYFEQKPVTRNIGKNQNQSIKCFKCKQYGHYSRSCTSVTNTSAQSVKHKAPSSNTSTSAGVMNLQKATTEDQPSSIRNLLHASNEENQQQYSNTCYLLNKFEHELRYVFLKNKLEFSTSLVTLLDSGSPVSFIQENMVPPYIINADIQGHQKFYGINGSKLNIIGNVNSKIYFENSIVNLNIFVVKNGTMKNSIILGRDFIEKNNMVLKKIDKEDKISNEDATDNPLLHVEHSIVRDGVDDVDDDDDDFSQQILNINVSSENDLVELNLNINKDLPFPVKNEIENIVKKVWFQNGSQKRKDNGDFEMHIRLTKEEPFFCAPRRLPFSHKIELEKILNDLMSKGIIRESSSPYTSPIVLVKKKNGEFRLCVDYRELNKVTVKDNYPLPLIEDHLDRLRDKKFFTTLDLKNGFHHVKVASESIKYTSFITPMGQYEYTRMPFGLKNSPSVFERYMKYIFGKLAQSENVLTFIDDILIATKTIDEHMSILKKVMDIISENSLQLRLDKCSFLQNEIVYLGYKINFNGVRPSEEHILAVKNFPVPTSTKAVHSFIGLCSYFRKFIRDFAIIAKPLYELLKKDAPFIFAKEQFDAFERLKSKLIDSPVLSIYNPSSETELHCDASGIGFGAVLLQRQKDGKFHPVFFFSKRATEAESRYHSFELETLAIVYALRRFRIYLLGLDFKIVTDCQSLSLTLNKKTINPRISRWVLEMQEFSYRLEHRKGGKMAHADALSRAINVLNIDESFEFMLAVEQRQDPKIVSIARDLEKKESSEYEMVEGLIYRKFHDKILFYVPEHMEEQVIRTHHEALGHLGVEKCHDFLIKSYWFPKMKNKIKEYLKKCLKCLYYSPHSGKSEGILHCIPKGKLPFDTVHIDHFGPLATSKSKKQHVLLVVDGFTKFVKLYPVKSTQSKEAIGCLRSYFEHYSRPSRIISDRGSCFTSKEFSDFLHENNILHVKIATHHPQSNGQVERVNRVLTPMLSKLCESDTTSDWDKHLIKIEYAMNNTINKSTGFTPSMLLFGVNQRGEVCDKVMEYLKGKSLENQADLNVIRNQAFENIQKTQKYNKLYFDKSHKNPTKYKQGDYVMLKNISSVPGINKKLFAKYRGPYEVEKVLSKDRYLVKDIDGMQVTRLPYRGVCAPSNMRPFNMRLSGPHEQKG